MLYHVWKRTSTEHRTVSYVVDNMVSLSSPVYIMGSDASRATEGPGGGRGVAVFRSHSDAGTATEVNLIPRLTALSRGCRGTQNFSLNQSASVWSSSFKAKLIPEERRLAESPEPVDWSSGMLGRRAGFEGGTARSVWSTHFWIWLWHLQQKNLRRQMLGAGGAGLPKMCLTRTSGGHFTWK